MLHIPKDQTVGFRLNLYSLNTDYVSSAVLVKVANLILTVITNP